MYVSVLFNEPKLLKFNAAEEFVQSAVVSVLFNEPKLLKSLSPQYSITAVGSFSALQRAEIAEIEPNDLTKRELVKSFSALQRAEIAEIRRVQSTARAGWMVSVLFNEPKLLKSLHARADYAASRVSVLFNEPKLLKSVNVVTDIIPWHVSVLFNEPKLLKCDEAWRRP